MNKVLKVILEVLFILTIIALILLFMMFSARSEIVPDIYVTSTSGKSALAVKGAYVWNSFSESLVVDSITPQEYIYTNTNTLLVTPGEKMVFSNSDKSVNRYKFYQLEMKYYDDTNVLYEIPIVEDSKAFADLKYLELNAPEDEGTYIYNFKFSYYSKGEVSYGLKVVVSTEPTYEIDTLIKYRNTKLTDLDTINNILNLLPYSKYKTGIILKSSQMKELIINYQEFIMDRKDLVNNIIAIFTLIPELDTITYKTIEDSPEKETYTFIRSEIENQIGRSLKDYSNNVELWKKEILFKEKVIDEVSQRDTIYKAIIADVISTYEEAEIKEIFVDTQSFKESEKLYISDVDGYEILDYVSDFSNIVCDIEYSEYKKLNKESLCISLVKMQSMYDYIKNELSGDNIENSSVAEYIKNTSNVSNIKSTNYENNVNSNLNEASKNDNVAENIKEVTEKTSGDNIDFSVYDGKYICTVIVSKDNCSRFCYYEVEFKDGKWSIIKL